MTSQRLAVPRKTTSREISVVLNETRTNSRTSDDDSDVHYDNNVVPASVMLFLLARHKTYQ